MAEKPEIKKEPTEFESLVDEKVALAKKLGLTDRCKGPIEGYKKTEEYKRINEIDLRLWELIK